MRKGTHQLRVLLSGSPQKTVNFLCAADPFIGWKCFVKSINTFLAVRGVQEILIPSFNLGIKVNSIFSLNSPSPVNFRPKFFKTY